MTHHTNNTYRRGRQPRRHQLAETVEAVVIAHSTNHVPADARANVRAPLTSATELLSTSTVHGVCSLCNMYAIAQSVV
jgi:hypothetical protein